MRAFTVATPDMVPLAQEAGRRLAQYGGVESFEIVMCRDKADCHKRKLVALLWQTGPVWFFDADWFMIRTCPLPSPKGALVLAAPCDGQRERYEGTAVPWTSAFCSCLLGLDMGNYEVRKTIEDAIRIQGKDYRSDEMALNLAVFGNRNLVFARLGNAWNWCGPPNDLTIAIHAAGRNGKLEWLKEHSSLTA